MRKRVGATTARSGAERIGCIIDGMTSPNRDAVAPRQPAPAPKNPLNAKKLLLSKWTAASPTGKEKHFVVTRVVEPDPPAVRVEWVEIEAVHSGRASMLRWRELTDVSQWRQGWA